MKLKVTDNEKAALNLIKSANEASALAKPAKKTIAGWVERNEEDLKTGNATVDGIGSVKLRYSKTLVFDID
jgi:hypothetical protein